MLPLLLWVVLLTNHQWRGVDFGYQTLTSLMKKMCVQEQPKKPSEHQNEEKHHKMSSWYILKLFRLGSLQQMHAPAHARTGFTHTLETHTLFQGACWQVLTLDGGPVPVLLPRSITERMCVQLRCRQASITEIFYHSNLHFIVDLNFHLNNGHIFSLSHSQRPSVTSILLPK